MIEPEHFDSERAAPILLQLLPTVDHPARETIVRRLKAKSVRPQAVPALVNEFRTAADPNYKWVVADTLRAVVDQAHLEQVVDLAAEEKHGISRGPLLDIVRRSKSERAISVLIDALADPTVCLPAMSGLRQAIGSGPARPHIAAVLDSDDAIVRRLAREQLKRIDKTLGP